MTADVIRGLAFPPDDAIAVDGVIVTAGDWLWNAVVRCPRCETEQEVMHRGEVGTDGDEVQCVGCGEWFVRRDWWPPAGQVYGIYEVTAAGGAGRPFVLDREGEGRER